MENLLEPTGNGSKKSENLTSGQEQNSFLTHLSEKLPKAIKDSSVILSPLSEIYNNTKKNILSRGKVPKYQITPQVLNEAIWGIHKKELLTVAARTSMGKSCMVLQMAKDLVDTHSTVIYFSLEMSKEQLMERLLSHYLNINNLDLQRNYDEALQELKNCEKTFITWLNTAKLLIDDQYGYDYDKMCEVCQSIDPKPDFVIIDHIQMISTKGFKSKLEAIEEYIRKLKQLAIANDFGVILVSQLNRQGNTDADMIHLKWAGILEELSDTVMLLNWKWENEIKEPGSHNYEIKIPKQRHGIPCMTPLKITFKPQYSKFEDWRPKNDSKNQAEDKRYNN